jgi:hypothetical protein
MRTRSRLLFLLAGLGLAVLTLALGATAGTSSGARLAAGGTAPESGPLANPGTRYSGDTSSDPVGGVVNANCCDWITSSEWWNIQLTNGQEVLIKGEDTSAFVAVVMPPGTTALKMLNAKSKQEFIPPLVSDDLSNGVLYKATLTGTYPVAIGPVDNDGQDGPFNFTLTIYQDAFLFAPHAVTASTKRTNTLIVSVRDKEGTAISDTNLTVSLSGVWQNAPGAAASAHPLASGHPANGRVVFRYRLPVGYKGHAPRLFIGASSAAYQAVRSVAAKLTVRG